MEKFLRKPIKVCLEVFLEKALEVPLKRSMEDVVEELSKGIHGRPPARNS